MTDNSQNTVEPKNYQRDAGGRFSSDVHRRVLGSLTLPSDVYGWSSRALFGRMLPDVSVNFDSVPEIDSVIQDLVNDGHAEAIDVGDTVIYRMTQSGFDLLTGPIENEPPPGAAVQGPAMINATAAGGATMLPGYEPETFQQADEATESDQQTLSTDDVATAQPGEGAAQ